MFKWRASKIGLYGSIQLPFLIPFMNPFVLDCFAEHMLFKSTLSRVSETSLENSKDLMQNNEKAAK